jgi:hypothetical protein
MGIEQEIAGSLSSDTFTEIRCPTVLSPISHPQFCDREIPNRVSSASSIAQPVADRSGLIIMNSPRLEYSRLPIGDISQV